MSQFTTPSVPLYEIFVRQNPALGHSRFYHHFATDCAKELFKRSEDAASLLHCTEKNWKVLEFRFFVGDTVSGVDFRLFWLRLPGPWRELLEGIF